MQKKNVRDTPVIVIPKGYEIGDLCPLNRTIRRRSRKRQEVMASDDTTLSRRLSDGDERTTGAKR